MVVRRKKKVARRHKKSRFLKYIRGGNQFKTRVNILDEVEEQQRQRREKLKKEGKIKWWHLPSRLERWVNKDTLDPAMMEQLVGSYKYGNGDQKKLALDQLRIQLMINDIHDDPEEYIKAYQKGSHRRKGWVKNATRAGLTAAGLLATGLGAYYFGIPGMIQSALTSAATTGAEAAAAKTLDGSLTQGAKSESMEGGLPSGVTSGATTTTTTPAADYQQQIAEKAAQTLGFTCSLDTQGQNLNSEQMEKCMAEYKEFLGYKPEESAPGELIVPEDLPSKDFFVNNILEEESDPSDNIIIEENSVPSVNPVSEVVPEVDNGFTPINGPNYYGNETSSLSDAPNNGVNNIADLYSLPVTPDQYKTYAAYRKATLKKGIDVSPVQDYLKEYYKRNGSVNATDMVDMDAYYSNIRKTVPKSTALMLHPTANKSQPSSAYGNIKLSNPNELDPMFGTYSKNPKFYAHTEDPKKSLTVARKSFQKMFVPDSFFEENSPTILNAKGEAIPNPNFKPSGDSDILDNGLKSAVKTDFGANKGMDLINGAPIVGKHKIPNVFNTVKTTQKINVGGKEIPLTYGEINNRYYFGRDKNTGYFKFWNADKKDYVFVEPGDVDTYILNNPKGFHDYWKHRRKLIGKGFRFTKKGRKLYRRYRKHLKHSKKRTKH